MATVLKQETKTNEINEKEVKLLGKWARKEHDHLESDKRSLIQRFAQRLLKEGNVPEDRISTIIARELEGRVTNQYIAKCLSSNFKDKRKVRDRKKNSAKNSTKSEDKETKEEAKTASLLVGRAFLEPEIASVICKNSKNKNVIGYDVKFDEETVILGRYRISEITPELKHE
jgi:hypothetical protein